MIARAHVLALSLLLGTASAAGAVAIIHTAGLGNAETKPEVVSSRQIAAREHKLDAWEASLRKALASRPPKLAPLNRYAAAQSVPADVGATAMPTPKPPATKPEPVRRASSPTKQLAARSTAKRAAVPTRAPEDDDGPAGVETSATPAEPQDGSAGPAVVSAAPAPSAASGTGTQSAAPPRTGEQKSQSIEKQCEALKQAAEGKGEQAKEDAEKKCEALKQSAEKDGQETDG
jgi:hypothetical protein